MAEAVAMRAAFLRLGFSADAANALTDNQGIDSVDTLKFLEDHDVENLCKVIRRPGGQIQQAGAAIPNPGTQVSLQAELNLKLACYWAKHQVRVSRPTATADITLDNIRALRQMRLSEIAHKDPEEAPTLDEVDWPKNMEALEEYLGGFLGETGIPLAYVVRKDEAVPPAANDPSNNYDSRFEEMVARAGHSDVNGELLDTFVADRQRVWELLSAICRDSDCWTYLKTAQRTKDGRLAYRSLYDHYLGPNNVDNLATMAERRLSSLTYNGETRRWDFEKYVRNQVDQHLVLEALTEFGYSGIDERSKVRHLMDGIKTDALDSVKTRIMSDAALRGDFNACVSLYKDFISQSDSKKKARSLQISAVGTKEGGDDGSDVEDRYYPGPEFAALTDRQKDKLRKIRLARTGKKDKNKGPKSKAKRAKQQIKKKKKWTRQVSAIAASVVKEMKKQEKQDTQEDESESEEDEPTTGGGGPNRNHQALTRQRGRRS
jgi:hypothetical protein